MEIVFGCCLAFGALLAAVTLILGDALDAAVDGMFEWLSIDAHHVFQPVVLAGGITVFGGSGLLLARYSSLSAPGVYALAFCIATLVSAGIYFVYVRPMKNSENSLGYSMQDLAGKRAEVLTAIPEGGYGEVLVRVGAGNANHIAASFEGEAVPAGTPVVVVEVKEGTLYVAKLD